jgi:hypothetical protein
MCDLSGDLVFSGARPAHPVFTPVLSGRDSNSLSTMPAERPRSDRELRLALGLGMYRIAVTSTR